MIKLNNMSKPRLGSTSKEKVDEKCKSCDQKVTSKEKAYSAKSVKDGGTVNVKRLVMRGMYY